jgi:hypothetical protein
MMKLAGSGSESGSISQSHGSADPDPHQNVMDPQHWYYLLPWLPVEDHCLFIQVCGKNCVPS